MQTDQLKTVELFESLFPIDNKILNAICEHMQEYGYDESQPIIVWKGKNIIIDGHTRLLAAMNIGIENVSVYEIKFKNEDEALQYAIHNQRDRRNITNADLFRLIEAVDKRMTKAEAGAMGGSKQVTSVTTSVDKPQSIIKPKIPNDTDNIMDIAVNIVTDKTEDIAETTLKNTNTKKSAQETADIVGTNRGQVEKVRTIQDHADEETKQDVKSGEKSINKAYNETQEKRKESGDLSPEIKPDKSKFNKTNDSIEWAKWSWNPVSGCKHGCSYCYARSIANRFYPHGFEPHFYPERLAAPKNTPIPKSNDIGDHNVFCVSMGDLFGEWVPQEWIDQVMDAIRNAPEWNFLMLTKNPERLTTIEFPVNAWIGTTVDTQVRVVRAEKAFEKMSATVKFISIEPFKEEIIFNDLSIFDWIIIGGQSVQGSANPIQPKWEWVEQIITQARKAGCKIYFKPNLTVVPKEYPTE